MEYFPEISVKGIKLNRSLIWNFFDIKNLISRVTALYVANYTLPYDDYLYEGVCPFCTAFEGSPFFVKTFKVCVEKQLFACNSCGITGNTETFMRMLGY